MTYFEIIPGRLLSDFIEYFWYLELQDIGFPVLRDIRLPDPSPEWIFPVPASCSPHGMFRGNRELSFFVLKFKMGDLIPSIGSPKLFGIRFRPGGLASFGGVNMRDFEGAAPVIPAGAYFPELEEQISGFLQRATPVEAQVAEIEAQLENGLGRYVNPDPVVCASVDLLRKTNGNAKVGELVQRYDLSRMSLNCRFVERTGFSPKEMARVFRLNALLRMGMRETGRSLADLALEFGYYDQPHLNHDFKNLTGVTPAHFFTYADSVIVRGTGAHAGPDQHRQYSAPAGGLQGHSTGR